MGLLGGNCDQERHIHCGWTLESHEAVCRHHRREFEEEREGKGVISLDGGATNFKFHLNLEFLLAAE